MKELLQLGPWECFSGRPRGEFRHPLVGQSALKSGRVPHSVVFTSGKDSVCTPLANEGVGLGPSSFLALLPLALPWRIGLLRQPHGDSFHLGVSCAGLPLMVTR